MNEYTKYWPPANSPPPITLYKSGIHPNGKITTLDDEKYHPITSARVPTHHDITAYHTGYEQK